MKPIPLDELDDYFQLTTEQNIAVPNDGEDGPLPTKAGEIEKVPTKSLTFSDFSIATYGKHLPDHLLESVREDGIKVPLLVTANGTVLSGNSRLLAAIELGLADVPVIRVPDVADQTQEIVEVLTANTGRLKTNEVMAREFGAWLAVQKEEAKKRPPEKLARGEKEGAKSRDRAAMRVGRSASSLEKGLEVVHAIDRAAAEQDHKLVELMTKALNEEGFEPAIRLARKLGKVEMNQRTTRGRRAKAGRVHAAQADGAAAPSPNPAPQAEGEEQDPSENEPREVSNEQPMDNFSRELSRHIDALASLASFVSAAPAESWNENHTTRLAVQFNRTRVVLTERGLITPATRNY